MVLYWPCRASAHVLLIVRLDFTREILKKTRCIKAIHGKTGQNKPDCVISDKDGRHMPRQVRLCRFHCE
jgi:hypothetical protein